MPMKGKGGGVGSKAVEAGGAFVRFFGKDNLTDMLKKMKAHVLAFSKVISTAGTASLKAGAALSAPLALLFGGGVSRAAEMDKLAESFGMSTEQLSKLAHAADIAGVSLEEVYQNQHKYTDLISKAPATSAETSKAAAGAMRSFRETIVSLQAALAPAVEAFAPFAKAIATFARENPQVIQTVAALAVGLLGVGVALKVVGTIAPIVAGIGPVFAAVAAAAPWLLGAAAIGALVGALVVGARQAGLFKETFAALGDVLGRVWAGIKSLALDLYQAVGTALGGIMDAFKAGDLQLAAEIGTKGIEVVWKRLVVSLTEVWVGFKDVVVDGWHKLASGAVIAFRGIGPSLERFFLGLWERIRVAFFDVLRGIVNAAQDVLRQLPRGDRLAAELDPIKGQLDTAQIKGTEAIQKRMGEIDNGLAQMFAEEDAKLAATLEANRQFRDDQVSKARGEFQQASAELGALRAQARAAAAPKPGDPDYLRHKELFSGIPLKDDLFKMSRGGFASSASLNQFGYGDRADGRVDLKNIAKNTARTADELAKVMIEFKAMKDKLGIVVGQ